MKNSTASSQTVKILIIEDIDEERKLLAGFLLKENYSVYLAADGISGMEIAKEIKPDLILLDVNLPRYNGYTVMQQMRAIPVLENIPVIFVTAAASPAERVKGLNLGAIDYIIKPFIFEEISIRLKNHLKKYNKVSSYLSNNSDSTYNDRLNKALFNAASETLLSDVSKTPNLNDLAKSLQTNKKRLNDAFKDCCNMTVFEYLRDTRMQYAKDLLTKSLLDINTISSRLGFNSPANFSTAFKNQFNISPSKFRNSIKDT